MARLMGGQTTRVSNSYSTANVTLTRSRMGQFQNPFVGGLVGYNSQGLAQTCYAIGFAIYQGSSNKQGAVIGISLNEGGLSNLRPSDPMDYSMTPNPDKQEPKYLTTNAHPGETKKTRFGYVPRRARFASVHRAGK